MPTNFSTSIFGTQTLVDDLFVTIDSFRREGSAFLWGDGSNGRLGNNNPSGFVIAPQRLFNEGVYSGSADWKQLSGGGEISGGIKSDGTLWMWGLNSYGRLGIGNNLSNRVTAVPVFGGATNWKQIACGYWSSAAIKTDGTLWTWGRSNQGQLGTGDGLEKVTPVTTLLSSGNNSWKSVSVSKFTSNGDHMVAIKTDGTLWAWGGNSRGQLGINNTFNQFNPTIVFGQATNWKQVSCGEFHTAAIKTDGTLWVWGESGQGRLGNAISQGFDFRRTPVTTFAGGTDWKQVSCGSHTAAIKTDGTLWTWGYNFYGQLGDNTTTDRSTPVTTFLGGTNWKQVSCGYQHTAAIKTDGTLWVWGLNSYGRLGINVSGFTQRNTPVTTFAGGTNWKQVECGTRHTTATTFVDYLYY